MLNRHGCLIPVGVTTGPLSMAESFTELRRRGRGNQLNITIVSFLSPNSWASFNAVSVEMELLMNVNIKLKQWCGIWSASSRFDYSPEEAAIVLKVHQTHVLRFRDVQERHLQHRMWEETLYGIDYETAYTCRAG